MDLNSAINATAKEYAKRSHDTVAAALATPEATAEPQPVPVDYYNKAKRDRRKTQARSSYGTRPYTKAVLKKLEESPVKQAYEKAKADIKYLEAAGDKQRAAIVREQFMEDYYMPAVDAAVRLGSRQDVLANKDILNTLDSFVLLDGVRGSGYTAAFVANMYEEGEAPSISDIEVKHAIQDIVRHCENGNIGVAIGLAKRIKNSIDSGDNVAIPEDYELIQKVAIRG